MLIVKYFSVDRSHKIRIRKHIRNIPSSTKREYTCHSSKLFPYSIVSREIEVEVLLRCKTVIFYPNSSKCGFLSKKQVMLTMRSTKFIHRSQKVRLAESGVRDCGLLAGRKVAVATSTFFVGLLLQKSLEKGMLNQNPICPLLKIWVPNMNWKNKITIYLSIYHVYCKKFYMYKKCTSNSSWSDNPASIL